MNRLQPGGGRGGGELLFVDVDNVLHQQVALQAVHAVAVQHHFLSAGGTAEATAVDRHGGPSLVQGWLNMYHIEPHTHTHTHTHTDTQTNTPISNT